MGQKCGYRWAIIFLLFFSLTEFSYSAVEMTETGAEYRFGKVKASPRPLEWKVLTTSHFELFFYQGMEELSLRCREILESDAYDRVYPDFRDYYLLHPFKKIRVILFTSRKEYQNSQATGLPLTTSSEGVANIITNRLVVIRQPTLRELRGVLTHEVTHLLTLGPFRGNFLSSLSNYAPGWMAEGLAEYYQPDDTRFPLREVALRDAVIRDEIASLEKLTEIRDNLDYAQAWSLVDYIARKHGREKLSALLKEIFAKGDKDGTYRSVLGVTRKELGENWRSALKERYVKGKDAPSIKEKLTPLIKGYGQQTAPKADGRGRIFFLSTHESKFYDLYLLEEGKVRRLTDETVIAYDISPDGERVIFISDQEGERRLYNLEIATGEIAPFPLELSNPVDLAWSPAGDRLAVAVNTRGDADLYVVDLNGKVVSKIAGGYTDETSPSWSPDGRRLVYVAQELGHDHLFVWDGEKKRRLTASSYEHRDPVWAADGEIYCTYGEKGYYQLAAVNPENGQVRVISDYRETLTESLPLPGAFLSTVYSGKTFKLYRWQPEKSM